MNNDFINKGFKKEFYENIDEYIEQINKSLKNEKNKTDEKINQETYLLQDRTGIKETQNRR